MRILVTSAAGANGNGYGCVLSFGLDGEYQGRFTDDPRIVDPRGLKVDASGMLVYVNSGNDRILALDRKGVVVRDSGHMAGLDPGGGIFAPDGRYHVGLRSARTIAAFPAELDAARQEILPRSVVPFPRGFAFGSADRLYLASGVGPSGAGDNTILVFGAAGKLLTSHFVEDPELSPLDLTIAPNGNVVVSSEYPFACANAVGTVREYDAADGHLVRVFESNRPATFRKPRGLRFGPAGDLYCVAQDEVLAFDFRNGQCLGPVIEWPRLNGQAIEFFG